MTVGGHEKMSIAVWKIKDLIDLDKKEKGRILKGVVPVCEYVIGKTNIHTLYFDSHLSDYNNLNFVMGVEKGIKFFTVKLQDKVIEEKKATLSSGDGLKNIYGITF